MKIVLLLIVYEVLKGRSEIVDIWKQNGIQILRKVEKVAPRVAPGQPNSLVGCTWKGSENQFTKKAGARTNNSCKRLQKWDPKLQDVLIVDDIFEDSSTSCFRLLFDEFVDGFGLDFSIILMIKSRVLGYLFD